MEIVLLFMVLIMVWAIIAFIIDVREEYKPHVDLSEHNENKPTKKEIEMEKMEKKIKGLKGLLKS